MNWYCIAIEITALIFYENLIHTFSCNHYMTNVFLSLLIDFNHVKDFYVFDVVDEIYMCNISYIYWLVQALQF